MREFTYNNHKRIKDQSLFAHLWHIFFEAAVGISMYVCINMHNVMKIKLKVEPSGCFYCIFKKESIPVEEVCCTI